MIITKPTPPSPLKPQLNGQGPPSTNSGQPQSPPPYAPYLENRPLQPDHVEYRQSPGRRFFEAFCVAVVIYLLAAMFTSSVARAIHPRHHPGRWGQITWPDGESSGWPIPSDGPAERCVGGTNWTSYTGSSFHPYAARVTFDLPVSSDALYLFARGSLAAGRVTIVDSKDTSDTVEVDVVVNYYNSNALDRVNVCSLQRKSRQNGVGIFTPAYWERHSKEDLLEFDINIYLPVRHGRLRMNAFETDLPLFRHDVGFLEETVQFQQISLQGANQPINVKSLYANSASIKTSNSPITGSFNTSTSIELRTSNSFISANVGLLNEPLGKPTKLVMVTSNGRIDSSISLGSSQSAGGEFNVNTRTSNKALSITYDASPFDSILHHKAQTSNAPATVHLHSAYEGPFSLRSSNVPPSITDNHVTDPSGQGRPRSVNIFRAKDHTMGEVHWGSDKQLDGANVDISTSNSPAQLIL